MKFACFSTLFDSMGRDAGRVRAGPATCNTGSHRQEVGSEHIQNHYARQHGGRGTATASINGTTMHPQPKR